MKSGPLRVAFFPCGYHEVDGVAGTSRQFEAFAKRYELPFLVIHGGPRAETASAGRVTRVQLPRSLAKFPIDRHHDYDLLFFRHLRKAERLVRDFQPDLVQITGPSDVGMLGALVAYRLGVPLAASWQANLHQYARSRAASLLAFVPKSVANPLLRAVERLSFRAAARFYKIPRLLFAPNPELIQQLEAATGKPCALMSHAVDTTVFSPEFRARTEGPFRIGFVGRLTAEKNVRFFARLEKSLLAKGHRDFQFVIIGQGSQEKWLRENLTHADFPGVLRGAELSRAFADLDVLAFPSETDTFGLVVLEALASGVPAIVTAGGGPKYVVQHGRTGYVANNLDEFTGYTETLLTRPDLLAEMRIAARQHALTTSWDAIFESMYQAYERCLCPAAAVSERVFDVATS